MADIILSDTDGQDIILTPSNPVDLDVQSSASTDIDLINSGQGLPGEPGVGVPTGGLDGQVLTKTSGVDYATAWETPTGGGAVDSVNAQTGVVVLDTDDISDSGATNKYVTAAEKTKLSNLSGVNTGDQNPGGSGTEIQYRASGTTFGAVSASSFNGSTVSIESVGNSNVSLNLGAAGGGQTNVINLVPDLSTSLLRFDNTATGKTLNKWVFYENPGFAAYGIGMSAANGFGLFAGDRDFVFFTGTTRVNGENANEKMRMLNNGNVGIGTNNPTYLLDVNGTGRFNTSLTVGSLSGIVKATSGLLSAATAGTDYVIPSGSITGSAATLTTTRTFAVSGSTGLTAAAQNFNGSANVSLPLTGTLIVGNGGTGATSLTGLVKGNGTSAFTAAVAGTDYQAPITLTTTGTSGAATLIANTLNIPQYSGGGSSGITRSVVVTSGNYSLGSTSAVDYVYLVSGPHTGTLPAASGNSNVYTIKNNHTAAVTVTRAGSDTIDGATSLSINPGNSVDLISNGTSAWSII